MIIYCDSSILLKRVFAEIDSESIVQQLDSYTSLDTTLVSSALARLEVDHKVRSHLGSQQPDDVELALDDVVLADLNGHILMNAADLPYRYLSTLDAIHVATAFTVSADLVLTLDKQMRAACEELGMTVGP